MAIVKMNKFTLLSFESKKAELLEKLQDFSGVEFIDLQDEELLENNEVLTDLSKDSSDSEYVGCEDQLSKAKFALEFLQHYVPQKTGLKAMREGKRELTLSELKEEAANINLEAICNKVKEKEEELAAIEAEKTKLQGTIDAMTPWEKFDVPFAELFSMKTPYFLGSVPKQYETALVSELGDTYLEIISSNNQDLFFLSICGEEKKEDIAEKLREFGFSQFKTEINEVPLSVIHDCMDKIEKLESKKFFVQEELAAFDKEFKALEIVVEYYSNIVLRKEAVSNFLKTEKISVIQGWVPYEDNYKLTSIVNSVLGEDAYLEFEDVKDEEVQSGAVPVKLKNNELNAAFEDITSMFSTPRYDEIDPTPFVTPFYLLFFGMMIADVGYGLTLMIATLAALKLFKFDEGTKKFVKFFFYLSIPSMVFGVVYGSFFGDLIDITRFRIFNTNEDIMSILILSVIFGVIQIFFGLGIKAAMLIKAGKPKDAFYDVGAWILALVGLGLFLGAGTIGLSSTGKNIALVVMLIGMITIVLTGGRAEKSWGARIGQGAYALYGITSYVGDLVSYTRLMALGLAGGSLAGAFNMMTTMIKSPIAYIIFTPIILLAGHVFNLALSLLGAYVHTCRLQYVEYFGKFYEGGGKAFAPFKTENKFFNMKKN